MEEQVKKKKRKREGEDMETIVWQSPANPPHSDDYIFLNGRRHVRPYYFEFICHVKKRMNGKNIVDLFAGEFKGRPYGYYVSAVKSGRIQVNGETVPISYVVKTSQKISHFVHRHEPPVMACDISILLKEPDVLTICKPASVPVHSCGQYRKNTVVGILEAEYGLAPLFLMSAIHRLDRLVSGLLILARSASKADFFRQQIEAGVVQKQYIAKVIGVFPEGESFTFTYSSSSTWSNYKTDRVGKSNYRSEQVVNANLNHDPREQRSSVEVGDHSSDNPMKWKTACTKFTRISTNGTHSLVLCKPITGRTHQIRVHLQYTGHPIANDMLYLSNAVKDLSTGGTIADRAGLKSGHSVASNDTKKCSDEFDETCGEDFSIDPFCTNCPNLSPQGYEDHEEGLWLHCFCYSGTGWVYECPYPEWASLS